MTNEAAEDRRTGVEEAAESAPLLLLESVSKTYGDGDGRVQALRELSLGVARGELVAITGPSGSGKSTALTIAGGLETPDAGRVVAAGVDLAGLRGAARYAHRRRSIGYVFQDYNLIPSLTAAENVALPDELEGLPASRARAAALSALDEVGLGGLARRFPAQLSGGQQQRIAIARALSGSRRILLADEPTGALDSATGAEVMALIRQRVAAGAAAVIVTHDPAVAECADRVVTLCDGRLTDGERPPRLTG